VFRLIDLLLALVLILIVIVLIVLLRVSGNLGKLSVDQDAIKGAIATCWKELGIDQDIGAIKEKAEDIAKASQNLENLFKVTRGRGEYGEFQLEQILRDILPSQYVYIRKRVDQIGKIPDAYIVTPQGILCVDSKFPLDNYRRMIEAKDEKQQTEFKLSFRKDVEMHIEKIKTDYVKPEEGTAPFAFGFIPSEAVYQYLTECEMDLVAEAAKEGVLLVSPATLAINLNLLTIGLKAVEITEKAEQIQRNLRRIEGALDELENAWGTLYTHIKNAYNKASEVNEKQEKLRDTFQRVAQLEEND